MNALFIGPYRQADGWGMASRDYIRAIGTQIKNLSTRPTYLTSSNTQPDSQILKYENSHFKNYDIVFQKSLPHCIAVNKQIKKNVGIFASETNDISKSVSIHNLNNLDEICVPSTQEQKSLISSGVTTPIKVVSEPIDTVMYGSNKSHKIELPSKNIDKCFKFYSIGEYIERKNFIDLVTAFHLAFELSDNVALVIKTQISGMSDVESKKIITESFNKLKTKLNHRSIYKQEVIICDRLSDLDLLGLHNSCDCFVMPSYGEAFCRPAAEALVLGKTPIVTDNTGMTDFINKDNGFIINSRKEPVIINNRTLTKDFDIYNANEYWYRPNIYSLMESMKKVYHMHKKSKQEYKYKQQIGIESLEQFSYETIGKKICT